MSSKPPASAVQESDIIHLVLDFLEDVGLGKTVLALEEETGICNGDWIPGTELAFLRRKVIEGLWDDLLDFFWPLGKDSSTLEPHRRLQIIVEKQRVMEHLRACAVRLPEGRARTLEVVEGEFRRVRDELQDPIARLKVLCRPDEFQAVRELVDVDDFRQLSEFADWTPEVGRIRAFKDIKRVWESISEKRPVGDEPSGSGEGQQDGGGGGAREADRLLTLVLMGGFYEQLQASFRRRCSGASRARDQCAADEFLERRDATRALRAGQRHQQRPLHWQSYALRRDLDAWLAWLPDRCFQEPYRGRAARGARDFTVVPLRSCRDAAAVMTARGPALQPHMRRYSWHGSVGGGGPGWRPAPVATGGKRHQRTRSGGNVDAGRSSVARARRFEAGHSRSTTPPPSRAPTRAGNSRAGSGRTAMVSSRPPPLLDEDSSGSGFSSASLPPMPRPSTSEKVVCTPARSHPVFNSTAAAAGVEESKRQKEAAELEKFSTYWNGIGRGLWEREEQFAALTDKLAGPTKQVMAEKGIAPVKKQKLTTAQKIAVQLGEKTKEDFLNPPHPITAPMSVQDISLDSAMNKAVDVVRNGVNADGISVADVHKFRMVGLFEDKKTMRAIGFSPYKMHFAVGSNAGDLHLFHMPVSDRAVDRGLLSPLVTATKVHRGGIYSLDWSACGHYIATSSNDRTVRLTKVLREGGELKRSLADATVLLARHGDTARHVKFVRSANSAYDLLAASCSVDKSEIIVTNCNTRQCEVTLMAAAKATSQGAPPTQAPGFIAMDTVLGEPILWASRGRELLLFDMRAGSRPVYDVTHIDLCPFQKRRNVAPRPPATCLSSTRDQVAVGFASGHCGVLEVRARAWVGPVATHDGECRSVSLSEKYRGVLLSAGFDENVAVANFFRHAGDPWQWDVRVVANHRGNVINARWSTTDEYVLTSGTDRTVRMWRSNL